MTAAPAASPSRMRTELCPRCAGDGETVCCTAYDVGESGPRGCICSRGKRGYHECELCEGSGEIVVEADNEEEER